MYRRFAFIILAYIISLSSFCQTNVDSIQIVKKGLEYSCFADGYKLTPENMKFIMRNNSESLKYLKKVQTSSMISFGLGYIGGFLIGWPIGTAIGGGEPNWYIALVGCGIVATTIPLLNSSNRNLKKAVDCYNRELPFADKPNVEINLGLNNNGLGISLKF